MANGKVCTGFSMPWVAKYANNNGTVTYSGGIPLARGVDVSLSVESAGDNNFYADNVLAESDTQAFSSGTLSLTVDGLKQAAYKLITGVTTSQAVSFTGGTVTFDVWDDQAAVPYVGVGFVVRYMEAGVTTYVPVVLTKCAFQQLPMSAATQGEDIDWQTTQLTAQILRGDDAKHSWKKAGLGGQSTESAAENLIKAALDIS